MSHGDLVSAVFNCTHDTINPRNVPYLGQRFTFHWCWEIEPEDNTPYTGQSAWHYHGDLDGGPPGPRGWVPDEDLTDAVPVTRDTP